MKVCLITDLHFGARNDSPTILDAQEEFYTEVFFPYLRKNKITTIINGGDTFDRRKIVNLATLDRVNKFFFEPLKDFDYHAIVGNHDIYFTNTNEVNSPNLLMERNPRHHIYEDELVVLNLDGLKFGLCPWINRENRDKLLEAMKTTPAEFLLGHFAINGFEMQRGHLCEGGLGREIFNRFDEVYSGHFHHPSSDGNIRYLGAPYEMDWSDFEGVRGFHILDTKTRTLKLVENPRALHHRLVYNDEGLTANDVEEMDVTALRGTFVKIGVKNKTNPYMFEQFLDKINGAGAADVKVVEDSLDLTALAGDEVLENVDDTRGIMRGYVEEMEELPPDTVRSLMGLMDRLYTEAIEHGYD